MSASGGVVAAAEGEGRAGSRLFLAYAAAQSAAIGIFLLIPTQGWAHALWQILVGWAGAVFAVVGVQRRQPASRLLFYFLATGVFLNATGILVATMQSKSGVDAGPSAADALYLGMFPGFVGGMALLIRRRSATRDAATLVDTTIITTGLALLSWVFIIRPQMDIPGVKVINRAVILAYPVGDLVVLAMMVRLVLGGGARNHSFRLMLASMLAFLGADVGWATFGQLGFDPPAFVARMLEAASMSAYALTGAAVLHPSVVDVVKPGQRQEQRLGPVLLAGLTVASLIAPAILFTQALRGRITDGVAIAISSTALFLLVVTRMAQLLRWLQQRTRELGERNRAVRLVLDTVNEGLVRLSAEGLMAEERSAMIDRWFGPFQGRPPFVDYIAQADPEFSRAFRLAHEALREDVLPFELSLAQLPARLRARGREYKVGYLPMEQSGQGGLLVVINDVTEQVMLAQQEAEQRDLMAALQAFSRDRVGFLTFFDEATQLVARLAAESDPESRRRHLHTLKGNASLLALDLLSRLCHEAEDSLDEDLADAGKGPLGAVLARWAALSQALRAFMAERGRDAIELAPGELDELAGEIARGMTPERIVERLSAWRCEPVERAFERLAGNARALARRLGKGDIDVQIEGHGVRLDPQRWGALWSELAHVVRNAVDHGFEPPEERRRVGKPARPRLQLSASLRGGRFLIELGDDGRGIDWEAVRAAARLKGLPTTSERDLIAAVLSPGLTTSTEVTNVSGRGLGMSSVAARVEELAGELTAESQPGVGTRWRLSFPSSVLDPSPRAPVQAGGSAAA